MKKSLLLILGVIFLGLTFFNGHKTNSNIISQMPNPDVCDFGLFQDGLASNSFLQWKLANWSETWVGQWWNATSFRGLFSASRGDLVNYTITQTQPENLTSTYWGSLEFGNLSLIVDNAETGSNLALSVYPWLPGLVTHTNWTWHQAQAHDGLGVNVNGTISVVESIYKVFGIDRAAINFTFVQEKPGNQNTTLTYDKKTGVLLESYSEINFGTLYRMKLILVQCNCLSPSSLKAQWTVTGYNEDFIDAWYSDAGLFRGYFAVIEGSLLNFTMTGLNNFGLWGDIEFGNFSNHVSNNEVAVTLALGMWPWNPGLFVSGPWQDEETVVQGLAGVMTIEEGSYYFGNILRSTKKFDFKQDSPGNQNMTLIYDLETGILLKATTELNFGTRYFLELNLRVAPVTFNDNMEHESSDTSSNDITGFNFFLVLLVLAIGSSIRAATWRKKQTSQERDF